MQYFDFAFVLAFVWVRIYLSTHNLNQSKRDFFSFYIFFLYLPLFLLHSSKSTSKGTPATATVSPPLRPKRHNPQSYSPSPYPMDQPQNPPSSLPSSSTPLDLRRREHRRQQPSHLLIRPKIHKPANRNPHHPWHQPRKQRLPPLLFHHPLKNIHNPSILLPMHVLL